jgi:N-methylhydantoinase B/oxoprolinase/acetone carboxylase alpha subunit
MNTGTAKQEATSNVRTIVITLDGAGKPFVAAADLDVTISPAKNQQIIWTSTEDFLVDFNGNSPFYEEQFNNANKQSGLVRRGVISSKTVFYEYSIIINGQTLDPRVRVDP